MPVLIGPGPHPAYGVFVVTDAELLLFRHHPTPDEKLASWPYKGQGPPDLWSLEPRDGFTLVDSRTPIALLPDAMDAAYANLGNPGNPDAWDTLVVNKREPHTYRAFMFWRGLRVCLHRFDGCSPTTAFYHPHPWPAAFQVLQGEYQMDVVYAPDTRSAPPTTRPAVTLVLTEGSRYEMLNPLAWHRVVPLTPHVYSVMVNGPAWPESQVHDDARTTAGQDLDKMSPQELQEHLATFERLLRKVL